MSGIEFNDFLNKFVKIGEPIKAEEFLTNLLIDSEQIDLLRDNFKTKFLSPLMNKIKFFTEDLSENQKETKKITENIKNISSNIEKNNSDIEPKLRQVQPAESPELPKLQIINSSLSGVEEDNSKKLNFTTENSEDKNSSKTIKDLSDALQKNSENNVKNLQDLVDKISINKINDENILKKINDSESNKEVGQEQKTFGPKETIISFSASVNEFISKKIDDIIKKEKESTKETVVQKQIPKSGIMDFISSLVTGLPALLAAVGGATVLAGMFWPEIKKYIGDTFGDKAASVFDQLQGTVNAIGKFFTVGGLQLKFGGMFKNAGELLGKIGDDLINSFKGIFFGLADGGTEGAAKGAATAITKGGMFKGILKGAAGAILKGTSKVVLKGIPLIGALISFADAYGRFKDGNIIQGTIDIAAGLTGLIPGLGTPISIGLSLLNAFIDTRGENKEEVKQQSINISSMLLKGIGMFAKVGSKLKFLPLIGTLLSFGSAWSRFKNGEVLKGVLDVASGIAGIFPGVGTALSLGIGALNSFLDYQEEKGGFSSTSAMLGNWVQSLWNWVKNTSFVKTILSITDGIKNLLSPTNMRKGLETLNKVPYFGSVAGVLLSIMDSVSVTTNVDGSKSVKFSFQELAKNLKKNMYKNFAALIPEGFGMRRWFADLMGVDYNEKDDSINSQQQAPPPSAPPRRQLSKVEKNVIKNLPTEYNEEEYNKIREAGKADNARQNEINEKLEGLKKIEDLSPGDKADIKRLETEKNILAESQMSRAYQIVRYEELKEGKKITTAEDYGITQESEKADLQKEIALLENQVNEIKKERAWSKSEHNVNKIKELNEKIAELKTPNSIPILDGSKGIDLFSDAIEHSSLSKQFNSLTYQPSTSRNLSVSLAPEDNMVAMKKGGAIDNTFKDLKSALDTLSFNINNLINNNISNQSQSSRSPIVVNNNNNTNNMQNDNIKFSSERDEIYNSRLEWVRENAYARII